jgi:hypothetical protein
MAAYRAALCALTGLPAASVTAKLLFLEPGELREV